MTSPGLHEMLPNEEAAEPPLLRTPDLLSEWQWMHPSGASSSQGGSSWASSWAPSRAGHGSGPDDHAHALPAGAAIAGGVEVAAPATLVPQADPPSPPPSATMMEGRFTTLTSDRHRDGDVNALRPVHTFWLGPDAACCRTAPAAASPPRVPWMSLLDGVLCLLESHPPPWLDRGTRLSRAYALAGLMQVLHQRDAAAAADHAAAPPVVTQVVASVQRVGVATCAEVVQGGLDVAGLAFGRRHVSLSCVDDGGRGLASLSLPGDADAPAALTGLLLEGSCHEAPVLVVCGRSPEAPGWQCMTTPPPWSRRGPGLDHYRSYRPPPLMTEPPSPPWVPRGPPARCLEWCRAHQVRIHHSWCLAWKPWAWHASKADGGDA